MPKLPNRQISFNRAVKEELAALNQPAADHLAAYGSSLGWWDTIAHCYHTGKRPAHTATIIRDEFEKIQP